MSRFRAGWFGPGFAVLALAFAVLFVGGGTRHAIGLVLRPMTEDFGWERGVLGGAVGLFMVTTALSMVLVGRLADRLPVSHVLAGGFLLSAAGIAAISEVTQPWHVLALYGVVFAAGNGAVSVIPVGVMIMRRFPARAASANGIAISGMGLGQLLILSGMAAVLVSAGWRTVFWSIGALTLLLVPVLIREGLRERRTPAPAAAAGEGMSLPEAVRTRYFWLLLVVYAFCGSHDFFVSTHIVAFAQDKGVSSLLAGNLLAFMGLAGLVGVVASGFWSDRSGPFAPTIACFVLRVVLFGAILVVQHPVAIAVFAILFGVTFWVTAPLAVVFVRDAFGSRHLGTLTGVIVSVHHICGGIGAFAAGVAFDTDQSYDRAFLAMGVGSVLALVLTYVLRARPRPVAA